MGVHATQIKIDLSMVVATGFATANVGGAKSDIRATGSQDEILFSAPASPSASVLEYGKAFLVHTHPTDTATSVGVWIANSLDTPGSAATLTLVSTSPADSSSYKVRIIGFNSGGAVLIEDRILNGTSSVTTSGSFVGALRVEFRTLSGARANAAGIVTVTHGSTVIGVIPAGHDMATTEFAIGLAGSLDDTATIANASAAPSGVTFSKPRIDADKLAVAGGSLDPGEGQGVWIRWTIPTGMPASDRVRLALRASGSGFTSGLLVVATSQDPAPASEGGSSPFTTAWQTNEGTLEITFDCSTGGNDVLCQAEAIVISQTESNAQSTTITLVDPKFDWHPEGDGPHKDVMVDGAELEMQVTWGGHTKPFFANMKDTAVDWGPDNMPVLAWPGTCEGDRLFRNKKTLETLLPNADAPALLNKTVLAEACAAVGVACDWSRVLTMRVGTPYHRQQLTPGQIVTDMLELSVDEWRTNFKTVEGYDPTVGGRRWEYDIDAGHLVYSGSIQPLNQDPIDQVVALRAIKTGQLVTGDGEPSAELRLLEFGGGKSVSFDPPVSMVTWEMVGRDPRGRVSDLKFWSGGIKTAVRETTNPLDEPDNLKQAPIWNCDTVTFTWGASNPDVDADLLEALGIIRFFGRPTPQTTNGEGEEENGPLDPTTRVLYPPGEELENQLELQPNPLLYGPVEMNIHARRVFERAARQSKDYRYKLPLNHLMMPGDILAVKRDSRLGGTGFIELRIASLQHSISRTRANRFTLATGWKYAPGS